jgi:transposase-like protein
MITWLKQLICRHKNWSCKEDDDDRNIERYICDDCGKSWTEIKVEGGRRTTCQKVFDKPC